MKSSDNHHRREFMVNLLIHRLSLRLSVFATLVAAFFCFARASEAQLITLPFDKMTTSPRIVRLKAGVSGAAIQRALDHLPSGGEVRLAAGIYHISEPISLRREHQTLRGSGPKTVLRLIDHGNCPVVVMGSPMHPSIWPIAGPRVADLTIDGNRFYQDKELWKLALDNSELNNNGICIWATVDARVENVTCCHCRSGGLVTSAGTRKLTVRGFEAFDNRFDGLACYYTEDSHFINLRLHNNRSAGISIDLSFNHNEIRGAVLADNDLGIFMRQSSSNLFEKVTILRSRSHGVFMAQTGIVEADGWHLGPNTECAGNSFVNLTIKDSGGTGFWVKDPGCTNNVITNANFAANAKGDFAMLDERLLRVEDGTVR